MARVENDKRNKELTLEKVQNARYYYFEERMTQVAACEKANLSRSIFTR
jgi:DNA-binding transcriptional regulator LsrR (DeoR family)